MFNIETIILNPDYDKDVEKHNTDMVGYVIRKHDYKVVDTAVIKRTSLASWYADRRGRFDEALYIYILSTASIIGEIKGVHCREQEEQPQQPENNKKYDPKRHVN